jgi:hypothetical protein
MGLPHDIPPIVHNPRLWSSFMDFAWSETEDKCGVTLRFTRDANEIRRLDRGDAVNLAAYDPALGHSLTQFGLVAKEGNRVVMTFSSAIYPLGDMDLRNTSRRLVFPSGRPVRSSF